MAIIYSFPEGTPTLSDTVLGTQFDNNGNPTKSFSISDIIALVPSTAGFVPYTGATQSVDLGAFDLTATSIIKAGGTSVQYLMADGSTSTAPSLTGFVPYVGATQNVNLGSFALTATSIVKAGGTNLQYLLADGSVSTGPVLTGFVPYTGATQAVGLGVYSLTAGSIIKGGGTASQYLMADGTVSTNGTLFSAVSTTYQTTAGVLQSISSAIPSGIFTSGNLLKLNAAITTTAVSVAIATIEFYINSAATTVGATLIGRYNGPIGNQYIPVDRFFWVSGTTIYGKDFTASFSTSTSNSAFAINSTAIPATQFYIIAQVTTTLTDRACISTFKIEKS